MARISFDKFAEMLDKAVNRVPPRFLQDLTGGFNLQPEKKRRGGYYIMGEYVHGGHLGCFIVFYYGSFVELLQNEPLEVWEEQIMETVLHELQHHLETEAGRDDLARQEKEDLVKAIRKNR
jgi:hypothetical protein